MPILAKLQEFLDANRVRYAVMSHEPAFTAQQVAAAQHVPGKELAKVVMVRAGDRFLMAVLPATAKLDVHKMPERGARLATEHEFQSLFPHCEPGAMPPFGNLYGIPVFVDARLAADQEIVFQAGSHTQTVRMRYADFARLVRPLVDDYALTREEA
jgi:Ala-tRNA(Pro) deacylase